jgi:hypothetical protein
MSMMPESVMAEKVVHRYPHSFHKEKNQKKK